MTDAGTFVVYEPVFERLGDRTTWGETRDEVQALCDAYNNGKRWMK